jgi:lysophospholipase L1-like esterase
MAPKPLRILWKVLQKLLIFVVSTVVLVVAGELVARAAEPGQFSFRDANPYEKGKLGLQQLHQPNFEGRWDGTWYSTNSIGLRGPEIGRDKSEGEYRVVCLGDSCTFGKSVVEADSWPRQLETMLRAEMPGRTVNVVNCGVNGFAGTDYIKMWNAIGRRLNPDLMVVGYNLNDFPNVLKKIDVKVTKQAPIRKAVKKAVGGKANLDDLNEFALFRLARAFYYDFNRAKAWEDAERFAEESAADQDFKDIEAGISKTQDADHLLALEDQVRTLRDLAQAAGAQMALFLFPYESQVYMDDYERTPIVRLSEICERLDVPFVDLADRFREEAMKADPPQEMFVYGDRYHPRPIGYRIVAENVLHVVRARGWLPAD